MSETQFRDLPLARTPTCNLTGDALALAVSHGITAYDACHVALAARLSAPLVTADQKLVHKLAGTPHEPVCSGGGHPRPDRRLS